jgi:hypothetical protein
MSSALGVRVATKTPSAVRRLGQKDPGTVGEGGVTGRVRKEGGESAHHGELLVTIEGTGVREDLDADVGGASVDVREARRRQFVYESCGVLAEHRDVGTCDRHQFGGQLLNQRVTPVTRRNVHRTEPERWAANVPVSQQESGYKGWGGSVPIARSQLQGRWLILAQTLISDASPPTERRAREDE